MKKLFQNIVAFFMLSGLLFLGGCGLHLRQPGDFPVDLRRMLLTADNVNHAITATLERQLTASDVNLTEADAPLVLALSNSKTNTEMPRVFNANADTTYTYTLLVHVRMTTRAGKVILDRDVSASESVLHNVNQVSPPVFTPLMRSTLTQQLVGNIYTLLISKKTLNAVHDAYAGQS